MPPGTARDAPVAGSLPGTCARPWPPHRRASPQCRAPLGHGSPAACRALPSWSCTVGRWKKQRTPLKTYRALANTTKPHQTLTPGFRKPAKLYACPRQHSPARSAHPPVVVVGRVIARHGVAHEHHEARPGRRLPQVLRCRGVDALGHRVAPVGCEREKQDRVRGRWCAWPPCGPWACCSRAWEKCMGLARASLHCDHGPIQRLRLFLSMWFSCMGKGKLGFSIRKGHSMYDPSHLPEVRHHASVGVGACLARDAARGVLRRGGVVRVCASVSPVVRCAGHMQCRSAADSDLTCGKNRSLSLITDNSPHSDRPWTRTSPSNSLHIVKPNILSAHRLCRSAHCHPPLQS